MPRVLVADDEEGIRTFVAECLEAVGQREQAGHLYQWTIELARGDFALRTLQEMAQNQISKLSTTPRP